MNHTYCGLKLRHEAAVCCVVGATNIVPYFLMGTSHVMRLVAQEVFPQQNIKYLVSHYFYKTTIDVIVSLLYFFEEFVY